MAPSFEPPRRVAHPVRSPFAARVAGLREVLRAAACAVYAAAAAHLVVAQAPVPWTDGTAASGVAAAVGFPYFGRGCAVEDFDGDGDLDLVVGDGAVGGTIRLYRNQGNATFVDAGGVGLGLDDDLKGLAAADYDHDGDVDLALTRRLGGLFLYANDGTGTFLDVSSGAGLAGAGLGAECFGCTWIDYDGDGLLDLYLARRALVGGNPPVSPNMLFRQGAAGAFSAVANAAGAAGLHMSFLGDACDWDDDGDADLLVCDDFGGQYPWSGLGQILWRNDGAAGFTDQTAAYGATTPIAAMGCAWGDVDRDGDFDYFLTNDPRGHVLGINQLGTGGGFSNLAGNLPGEWGVVEFAVGWGCSFFDYDADGFVDLYVAQSNGATSRLFKNSGAPPMTDVAGPLGLALTMAANAPDCVTADFDGDGDLDLFEPIAGAAGRLMLNPGLGGNRWLKTRLVGRTSNRSSIGARVRVMAGGAPRIDAVRGRAGYLSSGPLGTYHGLGSHQTADLVEAKWPSGASISLAGPVATNVTLTLVEPKLSANGVWTQGSVQPMTLDCPGDGGVFGLVVLSVDPTPTPLGDGRNVPLTLDLIAQFCLLPGNPLIANNAGPLSAAGQRTAYAYIPVQPALAGFSVFAAGATLDPASPVGVRSLTARHAATIQ